MTFKNFIAVALIILMNFNAIAQEKKSFSTINVEDNIIMTWNKNTPESEMKDDIKALSEKGITIKYSGIKRNSNNEITAIKVEFSDRKGNKGILGYDNQKPIGTIKFFNQNGEIGFGEPSNSNDMLASNDFFNNLNNPQDIIKQFQFKNGENDSQTFSYNFGDGESLGKSSSKMIIKKDGKKPLVIQDGDVVEGGDDYTKEELEDIKKGNRFEYKDSNELNKNEFDFRNNDGLENFKKQIEKIQIDIDKPKPNSSSDFNNDFDKTKNEMLKAKEEMIKAKEEMEKAKSELEKAKSTLKTQKT